MAELNWTRESEIWLKDIYSYIAADDSDADLLKSSTADQSSASWYRYEPEQSREVRILLFEHYRITYLIKADGNIDIIGVFHGALDIDRFFL